MSRIVRRIVVALAAATGLAAATAGPAAAGLVLNNHARPVTGPSA